MESKYSAPESSGTSQPASTLAESLANPGPSIRQQIRKLYGRSQEQGTSGFNPSAVAAKPRKKPLSLSSRKSVVAVCVPERVYVVPKRKQRDQLITEGRVKEITLDKKATEEEVIGLLTQVFPQIASFVFLKVLTTSRELVPAELPEGHEEWNGAAVLSLAENGSLYVKPKTSSPCDIGPPATPASKKHSLATKTLDGPSTSKKPRIAPSCSRVVGTSQNRASTSKTNPNFSTSQATHGPVAGDSAQKQPLVQVTPQYVVGPRVYAVVLGQDRASDSSQSGERGKVFDAGIHVDSG